MSVTTADAEERGGGSAERSLRLLALLADEGRALGLAELAQRLALPKATVHRLCTALLASGWLARDLDEKSFAAGPALRRLALDTLNHGEQRGQRHAVLDALVQEVGETCNFTTLDGAEVLYLDRVEARWPLRLTLDVGSHVPLHCTASGKLFLALMAPGRREPLLHALALPRMTANTLTEAAALRAECEAIAARDYATDHEEYIAGLVAVAVPVRDRDGQVRAALAVHAPSARMPMDQALARLPALRRAAERMGELL
ncbi:IclR family transcriptional regulator [Piscinibacter sakaiensis]|uniref:Transcriptional regulator, IclR family n=1 Tax=Piscinibacter sakaiensis TaxID=1547922 RepID=A0A0K8NZH1_PISS1|nr:IclR family transcriptional regulator [Piscinibacter sakaiensis]GAP35802.1 transcriptional regulator, IclR family [Piscinibacter sakaiensis]